jgi:hypothetical protein
MANRITQTSMMHLLAANQLQFIALKDERVGVGDRRFTCCQSQRKPGMSNFPRSSAIKTEVSRINPMRA